MQKSIFVEFRDEVNSQLSGMANDNLLINGCLRVWARGGSFVAPDDYTADMFLCSGTGTVSSTTPLIAGLSSGGMKVVGTVNVQSKMEDINYAKIAGKTVTLSYSVDGQIITDTYVAPVVSGHPTVVNLNLSDCTLNWVKLEVGERASPMIPRHINMELLACMRYQKSLSGSVRMSLMNGANGTIYFQIPTDVNMRVNPRLVTGNILEVRSTSYVAQSGFTFASEWVYGFIGITAVKPSHGLTDAALRFQGLLLDANM